MYIPLLGSLVVGALSAWPWQETKGGWIDFEGQFWSTEVMANFSQALKDLSAAPRQRMNPNAKLQAQDSSTRAYAAGNGGSFVIVGDWGNPFTPGAGPCADGGFPCSAYWGPHYRCNTHQATGARCQTGTPEYVRDDLSQLRVAEHMTAWAKTNDAGFVINVGDNLYPQGYGWHDAAWEKVFEKRYPDAALQIPWLSCLGNHDWGGFNCFMDGSGQLTRPDPQIGYDTEHDWEWPAHKKSRWVLPHPFYKKRIFFGNVTIDVVAVDTNWVKVEEPCGQDPNSQRHCDVDKCHKSLFQLREDCWKFIESEMSNSDAIWKFIFAHHPIYFLGDWMNGDQRNIIDQMKRLNVSAYFAGHVHGQKPAFYTKEKGQPAQRHDSQRPGAVFEVLSGGGGGAWSDMGGDNMYGFVGVKVTENEVKAEFISDENKKWATFTVGPPCHQYHGGCEWEVGPWGECVDGARSREVSCSRGKEEYCTKEKPEVKQDCDGPSPSPGPGPSGGGSGGVAVIAATIGIGAVLLGVAGFLTWRFCARRWQAPAADGDLVQARELGQRLEPRSGGD